MKVGLVLSGFATELGGGYTFEQEVIESLARIESATSHSFHVFDRKSSGADRSENAAFEIVPIRPFQRATERLRSTWRFFQGIVTKQGFRRWRRGYRRHWLEDVLRRHQIDVVWFLTPAPFVVDIPYITVVWDLQHRRQPYFPEVSAQAEWESRERSYSHVLGRASYVITGTNVGRHEIEHFYRVSPERIRILPHPTPRFAFERPAVDESAVLKRWGLSPGYLFYPAQFWPHKNHANLLYALRELHHRGHGDLQLVLAGSDKGNIDHVRNLAAEAGLAQHVRFLGFVTQQQLLVLYRNALALTYVTHFGPENLPPLEAFAARCPVVASRVAGADEQLGDAALLVDPCAPSTIAAAVESLKADPALRQMLIDRGSRRAERFRGEDFVREVSKMLDEFAAIRACWAA